MRTYRVLFLHLNMLVLYTIVYNIGMFLFLTERKRVLAFILCITKEKYKKLQKYLHMSKKSSTFAVAKDVKQN